MSNHTSCIVDSSIDTIIDEINSQQINKIKLSPPKIAELDGSISSDDCNDIHDNVLSSSLNALHIQSNSNTINHKHHTNNGYNHGLHESLDDLELLQRNNNSNDILHSTPHRVQHSALLDTNRPDNATQLFHNNPIQRSNSNIDLDQSQTQTQRQLTRRALNASIDRANQFKSSSSIARFSVNTVDKLTPNFVKNIAVNKWKTYGDPLVTYLDANVDRAVDLIDSTGFLPHTIQAMTSPMQIPIQHNKNNILHRDTLNLNHAHQYNDQHHTFTSHHNIHSDESPCDPHESSSLESSLDRHTALMLLDKDARTMYQQYWERLKEKFVQSAWYSKVDDILLQNIVVKAFSNRVTDWQRPAEVFYNTVTEEFMSHGTYDDFIHALIIKLGPAWDDRLTPLAKGFYTTAKAVSALVGAGKFVGGALQLGKMKVHSAIDDLLAKWDRVLGLTDNMIDRYLPERTDSEPRPPQLMSGADSGKRRHQLNINGSSEDYSDYSDSDDSDISELDDDDVDDHVFDMDLDHHTNNNISSASSSDSDSSHNINGISTNKKRTNDHLYIFSDVDGDTTIDLISPTSLDREHSVPGIAQKLNKRIRQRIPSISNSISTVTQLSNKTVDVYTDELKQILSDNGWFTTVDTLLMQNMFVKALASFIRPAEHFFNTSLHLFQRRVSMDCINRSHTNSTSSSNDRSMSNKHHHANDISASDTTDNDDEKAMDTTNNNNPNSTNGILTTSHHTASSSSIASTVSTSVPTREPSPEVIEDFVIHLRDAMGASWDERLVAPAKSFLTTAIELRAAIPNSNNIVQQRAATQVPV